MDLLTKEQPVVNSHISFQNEMGRELPIDAEFYPGKMVLDKDRNSEDDDELTRRAKTKLRQNITAVESSPNFYRMDDEKERILKLQHMHINSREVEHYQKKVRQARTQADQDHFLGMTLAELIVTAKRDPFTLSKLQIKSPRRHVGGDRLLESDGKLSQLFLDKLQWDPEELKRSLSNSDFRKRLVQSNMYKKEPPMGLKVSRSGNSIIGINDSDEIEDNIGIGEDLELAMKRSTKSESIIEELALSKSYSVKGRGGIIRNRSKGKLEDQSRGIMQENESSGFGFVVKNKDAREASPATKEFRIKTEESDSDPFGVGPLKPKETRERSPNLILVNRLESEISNSGEANKKKEPKLKSPRDKIRLADEPHEFGKVTQPKKLSIYDLDSRIYGDIVEKNEFIHPEPEIYKAKGNLFKTISQGLVAMHEDQKLNQEFIDQVASKTEGIKKNSPFYSKEDQIQKFSSENERINKKLLNKISFAREKVYDPKFIEQMFEELVHPLNNYGDSPVREGGASTQYNRQVVNQRRDPSLSYQPTTLAPVEPFLQSQAAKANLLLATIGPTHEMIPFNDLYYKALHCRDNLSEDEKVSEELRLCEMQNRVDKLKNIEFQLANTLEARRQETDTFKQRELEKVREKYASERDRRELQAKKLAIKEQLRAHQKESIVKDKYSQPQLSNSNKSPSSREREKREIVKPQVVPAKPERSRVWDRDLEHRNKVREMTEEDSANSATLVSDYPEREEGLVSISWIETVDNRQRKFTNL